ncbi:MAG: hypothetical protein V5804_11340 [Mucilaginibacter sp.]|uniref:hypothetical protein n=1 Tax=Mucilaginibacter sp. TaxID=1882438 RepID=UPI0034E4BEE2
MPKQVRHDHASFTALKSAFRHRDRDLDSQAAIGCFLVFGVHVLHGFSLSS